MRSKAGSFRLTLTAVFILSLVFSGGWFVPSVTAHATAANPYSVLNDAAPVPNGDTVGVPWTGGLAETETTAQIMERQRLADLQPKQAQVIRPRLTISGDKAPNPNALDTAQAAPDQSSAAKPNSPQTLGLNFLTSTFADKGLFPPDTMGTVGPSQFTVAVNNIFRTYNKTTGVADGMLNSDPTVFFAAQLTVVAGNRASDPHIRYDRATKRWFIVMIDVAVNSNRVLLAVTDAASQGVISLTTVWSKFFFQQDTVGTTPNVDTGHFADFPTLGVDTNALYIGFNMFTSSTGSFAGTTGFVVRKSSILGAGPIVVTAFRGLATNNSVGILTPQGVDNFDPSPTFGYFIGVDGSVESLLQLRRITNTATTPSISANIPLTVNITGPAINAPHLGNTGGANGKLDASDERLLAAVIRNGHLWTAHAIGVDNTGSAAGTLTRDGARWYDIINFDTTPTVNQSGTVFDPTAPNDANQLYYIYPTVMVSGQGHVAMGFTRTGANVHINAATVGRLASDAPGTMESVVTYTNSTTAYNLGSGGPYGRRWGDYSYTSLDPDDDMTMWTIQEFCNATNSYGEQVVKLLAPPPATPSSAPTVAAGQSSVNVVVVGTSTTGSGFFDPGAGFSKHLTATVSGGIVVNSATYSDPTYVTLNLSTVGVAPGAYNVTITNPDGQTATGTGILTIPGPGTLQVNPTFLNFTATAGGPNPPSQPVTLTAMGGTITYTTGISYSAGASGWLTATPTSGSVISGTNQTVTLAATTTGLVAGTYTATVTFQDTNNMADTALETVTLTVNPAPHPPTVYTYYLPFLANNYNPGAPITGTFTSYLAFQNAGNGPASATINYFNSTGVTLTGSTVVTTVAQYGEALPANPFANNTRGAGVIASNQPLNVIVAEGTPFGGSAYAVNQGANSQLVAPLAINNNNNFVTQITVFNGGTVTTTATLTYYKEDGTSPANQVLTIGPRQSAIADQTNVSGLASNFYGWAAISSTVGSQLVAQVLEQRPDIKFVAIANAQPASQTTLYAPAVFNNAYGGFFTGANIVNPNSTPVTVSISYYDLGGTRFTATPFVLVGRGVQQVFQGGGSGNGIPAGGLPANFVGAAVITSTGGGVNTVVNEFKQVATGSQSGVYAAASGGSGNLGLPVIAKNGFGYTTGTTIFNASNISATFTLTYYNVNGTALTTPAPRSITVAAYASVGVYQGDDLGSDFYGTAVLTQTSGGSTLIDTTNAINGSVGLFYTYTEPAQ